MRAVKTSGVALGSGVDNTDDLAVVTTNGVLLNVAGAQRRWRGRGSMGRNPVITRVAW